MILSKFPPCLMSPCSIPTIFNFPLCCFHLFYVILVPLVRISLIPFYPQVGVTCSNGSNVDRLSPWASYVCQPNKDEGLAYEHRLWNPPKDQVTFFCLSGSPPSPSLPKDQVTRSTFTSLSGTSLHEEVIQFYHLYSHRRLMRA